MPTQQYPAGMQAEVKDAYWALSGIEDLKTQPGPALVESPVTASPRWQAGTRRPTRRRWCLSHTDYPYLRSPPPTDPIHFPTRRRTKVIGRLPGETSCLTLVWAVLDRASRGWRGLTMTSDGLRMLQDLRRSLPEPPRQLRPRTATTRDDAAHRQRQRHRLTSPSTGTAPVPFYRRGPGQAGATAPARSPAGSALHHPQTATSPRSFDANDGAMSPVVCGVARVTLISPAT